MFQIQTVTATVTETRLTDTNNDSSFYGSIQVDSLMDIHNLCNIKRVIHAKSLNDIYSQSNTL